MACVPMLIMRRNLDSRQISDNIWELAVNQDHTKSIGNAIRLLYDAENNFRIYTLTREKRRVDLYTRELEEVSDLLEEIDSGNLHHGQLMQIMAEKRFNTDIVLDARKSTDSLWNQAVYIENNLPYLNFGPKSAFGSGGKTRVSNDSAVVESYLVYQRKQHKGLLGRLKDAILDNAAQKTDSVKKVKTIRLATVTGLGSEPRIDTAMLSVNPWSTLLRQLVQARGGLRDKYLLLLESNEALFTRLKGLLAEIQIRAFRMRDESASRLTSNTEDVLARFRYRNLLIECFIIALTLIILALIWQFYRNGLALFYAKRKAENFARLKSTFAATVSHEIRGLTHAINASLEQLNEKQAYSKRKELLHGMKQSWEVLLSMLNNILDYSRMELKGVMPDPEPFSPAGAIREVVSIMRIRAAAKQVDFDLQEGVEQQIRVLGNEAQFKQVVINLVGNAIKFTQKGYIRVESSIGSQKSHGVTVRVIVRDTGRGIEEKDLPYIFEEFHQVNPKEDGNIPKGSGLGLAIVKKIIEQHGGTISVKSVPGTGSTFCFEIPFKAIQTEATPKALPAARKRAQLSGVRMITVENELLHRKFLTILLKNEKAVILEAASGKEALELLQDNEVDIILTDINMPEMTGLELARKIRQLPDKRNASLPVLAVTATVSQDDLQRFREAGISEYLIKPFTPQDLLEKINALISPVAR